MLAGTAWPWTGLPPTTRERHEIQYYDIRFRSGAEWTVIDGVEHEDDEQFQMHTIRGLANQIEYDIQVRAVSVVRREEAPDLPLRGLWSDIHTGIPTNERVAAQGIVDIENWNDRVWGITEDGKLYDTFALSNSWEFQSAIPVHETPVQNMFIYRDVSGEPVIHALTETALWIHDHANQRFLKTDVTFPRSPRNGLGAVVWRGDLYISAGLSVYRYGGGGAPVLSLVGPDRDQGVPWPGESMIVKLVPTHNRLLAAIQNLRERNRRARHVARSGLRQSVGRVSGRLAMTTGF